MVLAARDCHCDEVGVRRCGSGIAADVVTVDAAREIANLAVFCALLPLPKEEKLPLAPAWEV